MGIGTKNAWLEALNAQSRARIRLCAAMADFSKQANRFNLLTGGWVSRSFAWHNDVFEPLLRAEVRPAEAAEDAGAEGAAA